MPKRGRTCSLPAPPFTKGGVCGKWWLLWSQWKFCLWHQQSQDFLLGRCTERGNVVHFLYSCRQCCLAAPPAASFRSFLAPHEKLPLERNGTEQSLISRADKASSPLPSQAAETLSKSYLCPILNPASGRRNWSAFEDRQNKRRKHLLYL